MLSGKCALITGSTAGLGYAIAESLAQAGASVVLNGLCAPGEGEAAASRLAQMTGRGAVFDGADLRDVAAIERMVAQAAARFGGVDIVVNNAVVRHFKPIQSFSPAEWDTSLAVNLSAAFHCVRLSLPWMLERKWGRIINLSSIYGARGAEHRVDYVTSKTALLGLTRAIAAETAKTGVTCNAVAPGTVPSPAILDRIASIAEAQNIPVEKAEHDYLATRNPTGRFVALENVGALVTFLCSPAAADITGAMLPIDGGWQAM
jgi:3-hydroxybutyrate dehydrogenase